MGSAELSILAGRRAFGSNPEGYNEARPEYPNAVYEHLGALCSVQGARLFEIGAGTGIATRRLLEFSPVLLTALEPNERSAWYLRQNAKPHCPRISTRAR
jgi:hypothetical protein